MLKRTLLCLDFAVMGKRRGGVVWCGVGGEGSAGLVFFRLTVGFIVLLLLLLLVRAVVTRQGVVLASSVTAC